MPNGISGVYMPQAGNFLSPLATNAPLAQLGQGIQSGMALGAQMQQLRERKRAAQQAQVAQQALQAGLAPGASPYARSQAMALAPQEYAMALQSRRTESQLEQVQQQQIAQQRISSATQGLQTLNRLRGVTNKEQQAAIVQEEVQRLRNTPGQGYLGDVLMQAYEDGNLTQDEIRNYSSQLRGVIDPTLFTDPLKDPDSSESQRLQEQAKSLDPSIDWSNTPGSEIQYMIEKGKLAEMRMTPYQRGQMLISKGQLAVSQGQLAVAENNLATRRDELQLQREVQALKAVTDRMPKPEKPTETQLATAGYMERAKKASEDFDEFSKGALRGGRYLGLTIGKGANAERANAAKSDFATAVLRRESGAAISDQEFDRIDKTYFPQPGDSAATIRYKSELRNRQIQSMTIASGPAIGMIPGNTGGMPSRVQPVVSGGPTSPVTSILQDNDPFGIK